MNPRAFAALLGTDPQVLIAISDDNKTGNSIEARLEQLNLTNASFAYLLRVRDLAANQPTIIESEWEAVYSILLQAQKVRKYAEWRRMEQEGAITLSPDHFGIPEAPIITFPPPEPRKFDPWRASRIAYLDWQDSSQSRIDRESSIIAGMHDAVGSVEEATLPALRDALVIAASPGGKDLDSSAKWVTNRLLIDAKVSGCQKTTRIAQAIETIQSLLFSLRTGQFYPDVDLEEAVSAVSWDSNRIDLFARSPNNVLLHKSRDSSGIWGDWEPLSGEITSRPAACSRGPGRLDVFARLPDNTLGHREFKNGQWTDWESLGGALTSAPSAVAQGDRIDVFLRGVNNTLQWWSQQGNNPGWETPVPMANLRSLFAEPTVSSWAPGRLDVFIWAGGVGPIPLRVIQGIWQRTYESGNWSSSWQSVGPRVLVAPAAISWGPNRIDLTARGANRALWNWWFDGKWNGPADMGGVLSSAPALSSRGADSLDVFVIGTDNQVWTRSFDGAWSGWMRASSLSLALSADNFDEEWKWIGSYPTWRAAMFVHMYPENIAHPSLRRHQTGTFSKVIARTRGKWRACTQRCLRAGEGLFGLLQ